jgi:ribonucleoside-diphosphate reductase alpha chain
MNAANLSHAVWLSKYCLRAEGGAAESHIDASWRRVAKAVAAIEKCPADWSRRFEGLLADYRFLPGGRILAGAGSGKQVTLFNCFVAGRLEDSLDGILRRLHETGLTMQQGGGVGIDFSPLRPAGSLAQRTGAAASGPASFLQLWDALCTTLLSTSSRRGAMMGTLACDHPDIEAFVTAKQKPGVLTNFNLSVLVSDGLMRAVAEDGDWPLVFPSRIAGGRQSGKSREHRRIPARELWRLITETAHASAEPGVLFVDTINRENNLGYCETISATNPCGEIPLPPHGACDLGSINLTAFVRDPFSASSRLDLDGIRETAGLAVRFLDDVIDASHFPLESQAAQARNTRRIGLGITGLADSLAMLGLRYASAQGRALAASVLEDIRDAGYAASVQLAAETGALPHLDRERYLESPFIRRLPDTLRSAIAGQGIRNSHVLSIAPAGTISLLAGNVSSGIEPIFAVETARGIRDAGGELHEQTMRDFAYEQWLAAGNAKAAMPDVFETATDLPAIAHLEMQAALQPFVDNAISKTINMPGDATVEDVAAVYAAAHAAGIKGCTVYRQGASVGELLRRRRDTHCCSLDREAD